MPAERGLRRSLALMLVATAAAIALLLPFTFWLTDSQLEDLARSDLLAFRLIEQVQSGTAPFEADTGRSRLHYYRPALGGDEPPAELRALTPGAYRELEIGNRKWTVHVRDAAPGDRAWLAYEIDHLERRETSMWMFVSALAVMICIAVWVFARGMVDRALAPLTSLVRQIRGLVPEQRGQRLELDRPDRELAVILESFNAFLVELDQAIERERTFAAAASHELRTPLTVIQGAARLYDETGQPPQRVRERLLRAVRELSEDLDALLALSQAGNSPGIEALVLDEFLPQLADTHVEASKANARIRWLSPRAVHLAAARGAVNVVFGNLLRNALRAARDGEVLIEIAEGEVSILDSGPGIPEDELPMVFEPRFRGHDGGSGMGLYIARILAARYGWRIEVANRPEGGVRATWRFRPQRQ